MTIVEQLEACLKSGKTKIKVKWDNGETHTIRIFRGDTTQAICYFRRRSRRCGYILPIEHIVEVHVPTSRKTPEQKWRDAWNKVRTKLVKSGLWETIIEEIDIALALGYDAMKAANRLYWDLPHDETQVARFKEQYPSLICTNDEGREYINSSVVWRYSSLPKIKKMRFERGSYNDHVLAAIQKAMDEKRTHHTSGRYQYDVSFEYNADKNRAWYSEEYRGCGNGHYYLALDATHALFVEDD
jgi:hypothetical protein